MNMSIHAYGFFAVGKRYNQVGGFAADSFNAQ